jgi:hypothetical protein
VHAIWIVSLKISYQKETNNKECRFVVSFLFLPHFSRANSSPCVPNTPQTALQLPLISILLNMMLCPQFLYFTQIQCLLQLYLPSVMHFCFTFLSCTWFFFYFLPGCFCSFSWFLSLGVFEGSVQVFIVFSHCTNLLYDLIQFMVLNYIYMLLKSKFILQSDSSPGL